MALKLASVLVQYLYTRKRLTLPGIGILLLTPGPHVVQENTKGSVPAPIGSISFEKDTAIKVDEDLIQFISTETGKMIPLAISDLSSYIELMQQFLNIGKPFVIEGVGTLVRSGNGQYKFAEWGVLKEKVTEARMKNNTTDGGLIDFKDIYKKQKHAGFTFTKTFIALLLFGGIAIAIWGGYALYNKDSDINTASNAGSASEKTTSLVEDSAMLSEKRKLADSIQKIELAKSMGYKFIFETTPNKKRAISRYTLLKKINSAIKLETNDSTLFDIIINMNIQATDTLRMKDSLNAWYWGRKNMMIRIKN